MTTGDPRADAWIAGYAEGLIEGIQRQATPIVEYRCTCGVMTGGLSDPRRSCPMHGPGEARPAISAGMCAALCDYPISGRHSRRCRPVGGDHA